MESSVNMEVLDITICPICRSIYEDPKMLPCLHSFCRKCLENPGPGKQGTKRHSTGTRAESTNDQSSVNNDGQSGTNCSQSADEAGVEQGTYGRPECRICQTEYVIPTGGFSSLPSNSFVKQLTALASLSLAASQKPCETCPSSRNSVSQIYCIDCDQAMCDECRQSHSRARVSQTHKCLVLGGLLKPEVTKDRNCYCELHPQNPLAMYCRDHKSTICFQCAAVEHRNDNCTQLSNVTEQFESQLNDDLRRVDGRLAECKVATDKLGEIENSLKVEVKKTEAAIDKSVSECIALIKRAGDSLREQLGSWKGRNLDDIAIKKREVERFTKRIDAYRRLTEELLQKGSATDLCSTFDVVKVRAQELDASPIDCGGNDLKIERTAFFPTDLGSLLIAGELKSAVGDLQFTTAIQRYIKFSRNTQDPTPTAQSLTRPTAADHTANGSQIPTVELDGIRSLEDASAVADLLEKKPSTIGAKRIEWQNFLESNQALQVGFRDKIKYQLKSMTLEGQTLTFHWRNEDIKPYQARLLMLINFEDKLNNAGSQCNVSITRDGMFIRGSEESTESAKIAVFEKINSIIGTSPSTTTSEIQRTLMKRVTVQEYVHGICQQRDIKATLASDPTLQVYAFDEQENAKLESMLPSIIKELEFAFDVSDADASSLGDELKKRQQEIEFIIDVVQKKIRIACLDKDESHLQEFVEKFIRDNSRVEKRVSISQQRKDYILQHKAEEFYLLKEHFQKDGGSLVCSEDAVTLKGKCTSVDSVEAQLRMMADSLVGKSYTVDHPAGESFLRKTTAGELIVRGIESKDKALITVNSTAQGSSDSETELVSSTEITSSSDSTILMRLTNSKGDAVTVVNGRLESQMVDAIVNSVDKNLRLEVGEISNSIFAAAGQSLLDECKKKAPVDFGKIVCTMGYNLPCKHVYHGAAVQWDGGRGRSKTILAEVIRNCLVQAHAGALRSIAFPAIGAGTLKCPEDVVITTLLEEIETFNRAHPATTLKDIRFVINSDVFKSKLDSLVAQGGSWRKLERRALKSNPIKTSLAILASSEKAADDVCKKIEDILKEHTAMDCIDSASDAQAIGFVTNEKVFRCSSK